MRMIRNGWMATVVALFVAITSPSTLSFGQEQGASEVDDLRRQVADLRRQVSEIRAELDDLRKASGAPEQAEPPTKNPDRGDVKQNKKEFPQMANAFWKVEIYRPDNTPYGIVEILADNNGRVLLDGKPIGNWVQDETTGDVTIHTLQLGNKGRGEWKISPVNNKPPTFEGRHKFERINEGKCRLILARRGA